MCFLVWTKPCFAAEIIVEMVWFQGILCHACKLILRLNCHELRELLFLTKIVLKLNAVCESFAALPFQYSAILLFKTIFISSFLAKWWHIFICKSPTLWANQCWRGCSLITHQGSGAHEHLPLELPPQASGEPPAALAGWRGASASTLRVATLHKTFNLAICSSHSVQLSSLFSRKELLILEQGN